MSTVDSLAQNEAAGAALPLDVASLLETLTERLQEPETQERWYPGSAAAAANRHRHAALLPGPGGNQHSPIFSPPH